MSTYNTLKILGKGTYGTVYLCERTHNKMKIVIKEINVETDSQHLAIAKNEVSVLKTLCHPNICQYYDSFRRTGVFNIVMEYCRHGNLYEYLKKRHESKSCLSVDHVLSTFCQILMALHHIHTRNIIHRDLKTENIFLTGSSKNIVKLGDFGISKILKKHNEKANTVIGTTNYLAPEMCDGKSYDMKSDIWSLGCILYELCALERLFQGSISEVVTAIKSGKRKAINAQLYSDDLQYIIDETTQLDPNCRPATENLMAFPRLVPKLHGLTLNLGNIP